MLTILIGRAGSGKSNYILDRIEAQRSERRQILLVPEHISHETELDLCRRLGDTASRDAEVLTFQNLANRVLAQTGGLADVTLDNGGKLLTMRLVLQELHSQLKVFGKPSQRSSFLRQLVELMDEFYAYEVSPDTLLQQVGEMEDVSSDKLRDIALLFAAYDAKIHADGLDARSRIQKLRDNIAQSTYLSGVDLYLDGFSFLNKTEEHILETVLHQANSVTVSLLGDKRNEELFLNAFRQRQRLERMALRCGERAKLVFLNGVKADSLSHLERYFYSGDAAWEKEVQEIALYEAGTSYTEAEWVAAQILTLVRSGRYRFRDIGVAARNMTEYGPILENVFSRAGIPAYHSRRSDILDKPVITMLLSAVDSVTGGCEYEDMFRYLKSGLANITPEECDLLENYVVCWEISGRMWLNDRPWTAHPEGYNREMSDNAQQVLDRINEIRSRVAVPLNKLQRDLEEGKSARAKATALFNFARNCGVPQNLQEKSKQLLQEGKVQLAEEYDQLWKIFCDVLDQFVEILDETELDGEEFARLLRLVLTQYSVGTIPATLDQVKISEITRNDRHSVKCLFLLGANDHVMPMVQPGSGVLDKKSRSVLRERNIELADESCDQLDQELQFIYACLAQPTEQLHVSWPVTDLVGSQLRPSFVVERIQKLFPAVETRHEDGSYRYALEESALELAGERPGGALWQQFADSGMYDDVLQHMARARHMERGKLSPEAVQTLYGNKIRMSASRMDQLKRCHFGYFMQYGLKAKERKAAGFDAPEIGTFIHYLLENVTRDVSQMGGYGSIDKETLRSMVKDYVDRYAKECIDHFEAKSARFRYLFSRLRSSAYAMIENIADELANSDFRPMAFELGFGGGGELPAITIHEGDTALSVSGKVDRVDGWVYEDKLYLRVVDYKTGKKSFDLTDIRYGLGIQMLLYLFTLAEKGEEFFNKEIVPAGVLYMPARDVILRMERGTSEEKLREAMHKELRRSGMVLSEPNVLRAMEHSALEAPQYLPLQINKDGGIAGGVATAAQLGRLGRYVDRLLHQIANELQQGNVDADPCSRGPQDSACTYCEFASACYFEDGRGQDRTRYLKKTENDEFWQHVARQIGEEVSHGEDTTD
ncbi:MAG: ATP-dependent nuclease subunit B [Ruminococcaceae bacterium]|nr:ATP-dependent nuclease subunit B [Oscillospiraceae bacterium]